MSFKQIESDRAETLARVEGLFASFKIDHAEYVSRIAQVNLVHNRLRADLVENRAYNARVRAQNFARKNG